MQTDTPFLPQHTIIPSASPLYACLRSPRLPEVAVAVAKDFSPRLQRYGGGCVVLDIGGLGRLLGEPHAIGAELARAWVVRAAPRDPRGAASGEDLRSVSIAVAPTQMGALLLSLAHPTLTVATGDIASALAPLPIRVLHQLCAEVHGCAVVRTRSRSPSTRHAAAWDACGQAFDVLRRWGLVTLGEFAALESSDLSARLGQDGVALQHCARGIDLRPLVPDSEVPRFLEHVELEWPIDGLEPLAFVLARMLEPLSTALERADRGAAAIHVTLRLVDRTTHARMLQLPVAMRDPRVLRTLLVLDLESHPPSAAIDHVTIEIDPAPGRVLQYSLLERARPSAETLATLTARLGALVGASRCGTPALLDSHHPDAFELRRFAPDTSKADAVIGRPSSALGTVVLRRFRPPRALRVSVERGRPVWVAIDRRGMPGGLVEQCAGPWRSSGAWWNGAVLTWNHDEWDVAFSDGSVCRLFREHDTGQWFMDGVVD
jgi:protein ImuB